MHKRIRVVIVLILLSLVATAAFAQFDEHAEWTWYSGPPAEPGSEVMGQRWQQCNYAYQWGQETDYAIYTHIADCDWCTGCPP